MDAMCAGLGRARAVSGQEASDSGRVLGLWDQGVPNWEGLKLLKYQELNINYLALT